MPGAKSGLVQVLWAHHPLRPLARQLHHLLVLEGDTVATLVRRMGLQHTPVLVSKNGVPVARRRWARRRVRPGDVLLIRQDVGVEGATIAAKTGWSAFWSGVAAAAINTAIAYSINVISSSLTDSGAAAQGSDAKGPDTYGLEGGSNAARPYQPLPLVLGEHRLFPDYASRPFGEYVPDPTLYVETVNGTVVTEPLAAPAFTPGADGQPGAPWVLITSDAVYRYYGDGAARTYTTPSTAFGSGGPYTAPHSFVYRAPLEGGGGTAGVTTWEDYSYVAPTPSEGGGGGEGGGDGGFGGGTGGTDSGGFTDGDEGGSIGP